ncbi:MAG: TonB-dependent receptor [Proteobacteria bacterium]|nr:TonB-dependent receptor [Pseudomonadota bacterium]
MHRPTQAIPPPRRRLALRALASALAVAASAPCLAADPPDSDAAQATSAASSEPSVPGNATAKAKPRIRTDGVFELGRVVVKGSQGQSSMPAEASLGRTTLDRLNLQTLGEAVAALPGASLSHNSRNEDLVFVRGFDPRQVPVFLDGIPQYVPYDGYIDFGRITTFDLAEIRVAKGAASLLYGPNTLGGAVNLVTRLPTAPFAGNLRVGGGSGGERTAAVNVGARRGDWYLQAGWSLLDADSFPLPDGFRDYKITPTDTGDSRQNAFFADRKVSLKLGWAPNARDEFAIGYSLLSSDKGNPVYTGHAKQGVRYWRWPYWDKDSLYFIGNLGLGAASDLKLRAYADHYRNGLDAYTNASYSTPILNTSFPSAYDDHTRGASLEWVSRMFPQHDLHVALHFKDDRHRESNPMSPTKDYRDVTTSVVVEDTIALADTWHLRLGASHDRRDARQVYFWPTGATSANNALAELTHELAGGGQLYASVADKTRFPTIKDRYSARMGTALPNPDLKPERARHLELGWRGRPWDGAQVDAALYESRIDGLIQNALVASNQCGGTVCNQAQNIGRARYRGAELSVRQHLSERGRLDVGYTWLDRANLNNPAIPLTDTPRQRVFADVEWSFSPRWRAVADVQAENGRIVASIAPGNVNGYLRLHGYAVVGAKLVWSPLPTLDIELGGRNLTDRWYELADGYPMPGRNWFANATWRY